MKSLLELLRIGYLQAKNGLEKGRENSRFRIYALVCVAVFFLLGIFLAFYRILQYINGNFIMFDFGPILISKILGMVFLSFLFMLLFSNIIVAISAFYLSDDMHLLLSTPIPQYSILISKFVHALINSSWMVFLMGVPIFGAYSYIYFPTAKITLAGSLSLVGSIFVLFFFLVLIASFSILFTMVLMRVFPAKATRDFFVLLSVGFISILVVLIRLLQPEKLTNPGEMVGIAEYMASLKAPTAPYLPSAWASQCIMGLLTKDYKVVINNFALLLGFSVLFFASFVMLSNWIFIKGWWNSSENQLQKYKKRIFDRINLYKVFFFLRSGVKELVIKDVKVFIRDSSQWPQLIILVSIIIIYIVNISVIPLQSMLTNQFARNINDLMFFFNMGFAGFIIAAVSARFVFSAISIEGKSFWIVRTAPIAMNKFLWEKFWTSFFPIFILSELLVSLSIFFLRIDLFMSLTSIFAIFLFSLCLTSMGMGFGAMFPKFNTSNNADIATSYGGIIYMIFAVIYIGISIGILMVPVHTYYSSNLNLRRMDTVIIIGSLVLFAIVQLTAFFLPLSMGKKALKNLEI